MEPNIKLYAGTVDVPAEKSVFRFVKSRLFMDKSEPVIIARAWTDSEASVIKSLLESYSIPCHYASELPNRLYSLSADPEGQIRIFVAASLEDEAKRILEEHRRHQAPLRLVDD